MKLKTILVISFIILISCNGATSEEKRIKNVVKQFSEAYFNYDLTTAVEHCTPESMKWIEYTASNVNEPDVERLRSKKDKADTNVTNITINENDSTAIVSVNVKNYLRLDSINSAGSIAADTDFRFHVVKRRGAWKVDLRKAFLQQNGKPYPY